MHFCKKLAAAFLAICCGKEPINSLKGRAKGVPEAARGKPRFFVHFSALIFNDFIKNIWYNRKCMAGEPLAIKKSANIFADAVYALKLSCKRVTLSQTF
jgi:hypothetical protein